MFQNKFKNFLQYFKKFVFTATTLTESENAFSASDQATIQKAFTALNDPNFTSFTVFDQPTQKLILDTVQKLDSILQTRLKLSALDIVPLIGIFGENNATSLLASNLSMDDYSALSNLYEYIRTLKNNPSAADLAKFFENQKLLVKDGNSLRYDFEDGTSIKQYRKDWNKNVNNCLDKAMVDFVNKPINTTVEIIEENTQDDE